MPITKYPDTSQQSTLNHQWETKKNFFNLSYYG